MVLIRRHPASRQSFAPQDAFRVRSAGRSKCLLGSHAAMPGGAFARRSTSDQVERSAPPSISRLARPAHFHPNHLHREPRVTGRLPGSGAMDIVPAARPLTGRTVYPCPFQAGVWGTQHAGRPNRSEAGDPGAGVPGESICAIGDGQIRAVTGSRFAAHAGCFSQALDQDRPAPRRERRSGRNVYTNRSKLPVSIV